MRETILFNLSGIPVDRSFFAKHERYAEAELINPKGYHKSMLDQLLKLPNDAHVQDVELCTDIMFVVWMSYINTYVTPASETGKLLAVPILLESHPVTPTFLRDLNFFLRRDDAEHYLLSDALAEQLKRTPP